MFWPPRWEGATSLQKNLYSPVLRRVSGISLLLRSGIRSDSISSPVRCACELPRLNQYFIIWHSSVGLVPPLCGSHCKFLANSNQCPSIFYINRDTSAEARTFVAIKILTSQATARAVCTNSLEFDVYQKVRFSNPNSPGISHCLSIRDCFVATSSAGSHICFVTDALSSSLAELRLPGQNRFTVPVAKRIIKQVLLALDYLHRECGFIHTGGSHSTPVPIRTDDQILRSQS